MNAVDNLIAQLDAIMCGQPPGAAELPGFDDKTTAELRAVLQPLLAADCRTCVHAYGAGMSRGCGSRKTCVGGDAYVRLSFQPMWEVK